MLKTIFLGHNTVKNSVFSVNPYLKKFPSEKISQDKR